MGGADPPVLAEKPAERDTERPAQGDQRRHGGLPITGLEAGEVGGGGSAFWASCSRVRPAHSRS